MSIKRRPHIQYFFFSLVYSVLILFAFNIKSILDFINVSIMYLPLLFIIMISNNNTKIIELGMVEIEYLQNKHKIFTYIKNILYDLLAIVVTILVHLFLFITIYDISFNVAVSVIDYITYSSISILLFISFSYFMSTLTFSKSITIFGCSIIWIFFMINIESTLIVNPFFYVGNPNSSITYLYIQGIIILALLTATGYLKTKSPYFLQHIRRV